MGELMKKVEINLLEQLQKQMPPTLVKDLQDDECICPHCNGLGMVIRNNIYGIKGDNSETVRTNRFPYRHQALSFCPHCYNGVQKICLHCGKPYPVRGYYRCNCDGYQQQERDKAAKKYQETILNAKEVLESSVQTMLYCEENDEYYDSTDDFFDAYNDEDFGKRPTILWVCSTESISLDAYDIVSMACENLHEDAAERCETKALQNMLDSWCKEQTGTTTYYPDYREYVKINWDDYK